MSLCLQQSLAVTGGATESVMPKIDAWLQESADHWDALQFVASRKDMDRYWSVVDFLLCEICPEERAACLRFYADKGPRLVDMRSTRLIACHEAKIIVFLEVCYAAHCEQRRLSWRAATEIVREVSSACVDGDAPWR